MPFVKFSITILVMLALLSPGLAASGFENSGIGTQAREVGRSFPRRSRRLDRGLLQPGRLCLYL